MMFISEYYMKKRGGGEGDTTTGFRVLHLTEKWKNIQILGRECRPVQTDQLGVTRTSIQLLLLLLCTCSLYISDGHEERAKLRKKIEAVVDMYDVKGV